MKEVTLLYEVIEFLRENSGLNPSTAVMLIVQTEHIKQDTPKEFSKIFVGKNRHWINKYCHIFSLEIDCVLIQNETQSQGEFWTESLLLFG